jgi:hypothetical protein
MAGALAAVHWSTSPGAGPVDAGRNQVQILAVPDDEHVLVRRDDGSEVMLAFDEIREATLVADVEVFGKRR